MTIYLYSGTPGSGKSLHATREIYETLKYKKKFVISNYDLNLPEDLDEHFTYCPNNFLRPGLLVDIARNIWSVRRFEEDGILLVIDECQLLFNSRNWNDSNRMDWLEFFSQHRKYGYKVIFIAQDDSMVDKQFRALIEYDVNHRKVGRFGIFGAIVNAVCFGQMFYACTYYYTKKYKLNGEWFRCSKKITSLYDSYGSFRQVPEGAANSGLAPAVAG